MLVTESGIVMLVRPVQREKAESPMLVTELGIVMLPSSFVLFRYKSAPFSHGFEDILIANHCSNVPV